MKASMTKEIDLVFIGACLMQTVSWHRIQCKCVDSFYGRKEIKLGIVVTIGWNKKLK